MDYFTKYPPFMKKWFAIKSMLFNQAVQSDILPCTCQFYTDDGVSEPIAIGTGVFIEYNGIKYVVSAAHVLHNILDSFVVIYGRNTHRLGGLYKDTLMQGAVDTKNTNYYDIGAMKLCPETKEILSSYDVKYATMDRLDREHNLDEFGIYLVFGFPSRYAKLKYKDTVTALAFETDVLVKDKFYLKYGILKTKNIIAKYYRSGLFNIKNPIPRMGVQPYGISGCGLWAVKSMKPENNDPVPTTLVAILTDWIFTDSNMIGINVAEVLDFIDLNFNDL